MSYKIRIVKGNTVTFYVIFLITVFLIFIINIGEDIDLITFYYLLDGALFYLIYQLTCIADSTWTLNENSFGVKGASVFLSKKNNDVTIPLTAISSYSLDRWPYYDVFVIQLKSSEYIRIPMVKYFNAEFVNFMRDFEMLYVQAKYEQLKN